MTQAAPTSPFADRPRIFTGGRLVMATHNAGKARELGAMLAPYGADVVSAGELGLPEPEETGRTFRANAELKALAAARASAFPALADDSGMAVMALGGQPGLFSARWAGPHRDFAASMVKIAQALRLRGVAMEGAPVEFITAMALAWPDGHLETVEGTITGTLTWPARGRHGFGYDPIFVPVGTTDTFAEMDPAHKNAISHRAEAFRQIVARCFA